MAEPQTYTGQDMRDYARLYKEVANTLGTAGLSKRRNDPALSPGEIIWAASKIEAKSELFEKAVNQIAAETGSAGVDPDSIKLNYYYIVRSASLDVIADLANGRDSAGGAYIDEDTLKAAVFSDKRIHELENGEIGKNECHSRLSGNDAVALILAKQCLSEKKPEAALELKEAILKLKKDDEPESRKLEGGGASIVKPSELSIANLATTLKSSSMQVG